MDREFDDDYDSDQNSDNEVEILEHDTDTEEEMSDSDEQNDLPTDVFGNNGFHWTTDKREVLTNHRTRMTKKNKVIGKKGPKGEAINCVDPYKLWNLFMTDGMINHIVEKTNEHILLQEYEPTYRSARLTDVTEIKAIFGLLYLGALNNSNVTGINDLFVDDGTVSELYKLTFSKERFSFLLRNLRFDTKAERSEIDRFSPVRQFFEMFVSTLRKSYEPSAYLCVDERIEPFKGNYIIDLSLLWFSYLI